MFPHCPSSKFRPSLLSSSYVKWTSLDLLRNIYGKEVYMLVFRVILWLIRGVILPRKILLAENLALRQQLLVCQRRIKRPKLYSSDRHFWVWLSQFWKECKSFLFIAQPDTVAMSKKRMLISPAKKNSETTLSKQIRVDSVFTSMNTQQYLILRLSSYHPDSIGKAGMGTISSLSHTVAAVSRREPNI
jgi:hypothetical protein